MFVKKTLAVAGLLAMTSAVAACGGGSSSAASGAAAAPTGATTATFCSTIAGLSNSTTPKQLGDKLQAVGTPSDIATNERHGFEVLVNKLETLADNAKPADVTKSLSATDQADVTAFTTYLAKTCAASASSTPTPTAPSS